MQSTVPGTQCVSVIVFFILILIAQRILEKTGVFGEVVSEQTGVLTGP